HRFAEARCFPATHLLPQTLRGTNDKLLSKPAWQFAWLIFYPDKHRFRFRALCKPVERTDDALNRRQLIALSRKYLRRILSHLCECLAAREVSPKAALQLRLRLHRKMQ